MMRISGGFIRYSYGRKVHAGPFNPARDNRLPGLAIDFEMRQQQGGDLAKVVLRPEGQVLLHELRLEASFAFERDDMVYCNGYQSWTDSREFAVGESIPGLRSVMKLIKMQRYGDINFFPYTGRPGEFHSHTYCYIRRGDHFTLAGSTGEQAGYTIFRFRASSGNIDIIKDCEGLAVDRTLAAMEIFMASGGEKDVFERYFGALKLRKTATPPATGWTSWYNYYTKITQDIILENAAHLADNRIPIDTFQIDDGFQTAVGDWLSIKPEFPGGMKHLADEIHRRGFRAGLWLAPFICEKKSELAMKHKSWLVSDTRGRPVVAGWNPGWSGDFYALDIYNRQARDYIYDVFTTVLRDWGYDMVKLDFLYAAAIIPRAGKSRGAIMCDSMKFLRECVKSKKILGCGVPLGPSFGLVDYCRIGGDVALKWEDQLLKFMRYRERVDTKHSLTSTTGRRHLNGTVFLNDPDVFILRDDNNSLTPAEKSTLFILNNLFGGLVFTSDDISKYTPDTMRRYRSMFPLRVKTVHSVRDDNGLRTIQFGVGALDYVVYANFSDDDRAFSLLPGVLFRVDPSHSDGHFIIGGGTYTLASRETHCFLRLGAKAPSIAGSTGHIFPGSEIASVRAEGRKFTVKLHTASQRPCTVFLRVARSGKYFINGTSVTSDTVLPETHIISLTLE